MSKHPPPLISTGEKKNSFREHVRRVTRPIFEAVAKETDLNHLLVGGSVKKSVNKPYNYAYYNPHNARYYFKFNKENFTPNVKDGVVGSIPLELFNKTELVHKNFMGCRIVVKKSLVEVTNKVSSERLFKIGGSAKARKEAVIDAVVVLEKECLNALDSFVKVFGGSFVREPVKCWIPDNKILNDRLVDSVPSKTIFRNEVVKKVYNTNPKNVEFSDPVFASNHFRNSGLYDFVPEIAEGLSSLNESVGLLKRGVYKPMKESLLIRISDALLVRDYKTVSFVLNELLLLDGVLHSRIKPLLQEVALCNGGELL